MFSGFPDFHFDVSLPHPHRLTSALLAPEAKEVLEKRRKYAWDTHFSSSPYAILFA